MFSTLEAKDFFSQFYLKKIVGEEEFAVFTDALTAYKVHLHSNANQNEDSIVANALKPFFMALGFSADIKHKQKGNSEIDLVLKKDGAITTIIEAKKPNSTEMFSQSNPNCKALHEAILYYFRERESGNLSIQSLIITDFYRFCIIKSSDFERTFYQNLALKNLYDRFSAPNSLFKGNTEEFYSESKRILETSDFSMGYFYFDLGEIFSKDLSFSSLKFIFKALHRDFLFGEFNPNDANILNEKFYRELLYILGLSEVDEKGREIKEMSKIATKILPSKESQNGAHTLYNEIVANLPKENTDFESVMQFIVLWLNRILFLKLIEANLVQFNDDKNLKFLNLSKMPNFQIMSHLFFKILAKKHNEREISDSPLTYLPYLNSSLFERHKCEEMLDIATIDNNAKLDYFATTQIKDKNGKKKSGSVGLLAYIFEFLDAFDFGSDESSGELSMQKELISSSVLGLVFEKLNGYKEGSFYTPNFITSYMCRVSLEKVVLDKFNETNPQWQCKTLDDIEEEIHREIRLARNATHLSSQSQNQNQSTPISSLRGKAEAIQNQSVDCHESANADSRNDSTKKVKDKYIELLESIHICDPAVGSGHFLVSALCEMVYIYYQLGLIDELSEYKMLPPNNDEIIIYITEDKAFEYKKPTKPNDTNQSIQKALFHLKKSIIENNLFGVDINPNSVEICKLRLWIELLKNSYYLRDSDGFNPNLSESIHQMQTLPNIDINIKCGNSLVSRFRLDNSLPTTQNIKRQIDEYKDLVCAYKNADKDEVLKSKKMSKKEIETKIQSLKATFRLSLKDPKTKKELERAIENHIKLYGLFMLDDESLLYGLDSGISNTFASANLSEVEQESAAISFAKIKLLRHKLDTATNGNEYKNAFEWRFEFPEVLNKNGEFMGFDLIIGNPPYIDYREINESTISKTKHYAINQDSNRPNIFCYFIERGIEVISKNGNLTFVNPITMLQADFAYGARKLLLEKGCIDYIADCSYIKVFSSASTYPALWLFKKNKKQNLIKVVLWQDDAFMYSHNIESYENNERLSINIAKQGIDFRRVDCQILGDIGTLKWGTSQSGYGKKKILLSDFKKLNKSKQKNYKPIIQTADIKRYSIVWQEEYIPTEIYSQNIQEYFKKPKIVIARMTKNIQASFDINEFYMGKSTLMVDLKENPYYILGILNSKLADFWYKYYFGATHLASGYIRYDIPYLKQLPIPKLTAKNKKIADKIANLVDKILESKAKDSSTNTALLESQIDKLVYQLYDLDSREIAIIESK